MRSISGLAISPVQNCSTVARTLPSYQRFLMIVWHNGYLVGLLVQNSATKLAYWNMFVLPHLLHKVGRIEHNSRQKGFGIAQSLWSSICQTSQTICAVLDSNYRTWYHVWLWTSWQLWPYISYIRTCLRGYTKPGIYKGTFKAHTRSRWGSQFLFKQYIFVGSWEPLHHVTGIPSPFWAGIEL